MRCPAIPELHRPAMTDKRRDREWVEFAVELDNGQVIECETDEAEARALIEKSGGRLMSRKVFEEYWSDAGLLPLRSRPKA